MQIRRMSPLTGVVHVKEINVTKEQLEAWHNGTMIQNAMPRLSASDREFIKTGITSEEWDSHFSPCFMDDPRNT